jgi:hypothetical protein
MVAIDVTDPYLVPPTPVAQTPGAIVGSSPQWEDGSDATYAEATFTWDGTGARSDQIHADLSTTASGQLLAVALTIRAEVSAAVTTTSVLRPALFINQVGTNLGIARFDHWLTTWDTIETFTYDASEVAFLNSNTMVSLGAAIQTGNAYVSVTAQQPLGIAQWNRIRVYELSIDATFRALAAPPLRRYPRADGFGVGPTRHYPPPPSRRAAGGYH